MANYLGEDDSMFHSLQPPSLQNVEEVFTALSSSNHENVEFMKKFRPELVSHPGTTPPQV